MFCWSLRGVCRRKQNRRQPTRRKVICGRELIEGCWFDQPRTQDGQGRRRQESSPIFRAAAHRDVRAGLSKNGDAIGRWPQELCGQLHFQSLS